jgi:hypothetical protein
MRRRRNYKGRMKGEKEGARKNLGEELKKWKKEVEKKN